MSVQHNERFQRHITLIEEALTTLPDQQKRSGKAVLVEMINGAMELDAMLDPYSKEMAPMSGALVLKRESFHQRCRDMGSWLRANCPSVTLD